MEKLIVNHSIYSGKPGSTELHLPLVNSVSMDNLETLLRDFNQDPQQEHMRLPRPNNKISKRTRSLLKKEAKKYTILYDTIQATRLRILQNLQPIFIKLTQPRSFANNTSIYSGFFCDLNQAYLETLFLALDNSKIRIKALDAPFN